MHRPAVSALALLTALVACNPTSRFGSPSSPPAPGVAPAPAGRPDLAIQVPADPREPLLAQMVGTLLERQHIRKMQVDDRVSKMAFAEYLERLDRGKLFLLKNHVTNLSVYAMQMDDQLRAGDLVLAREGAAVVRQRQAVVAKVVEEVLGAPFDFQASESYETDAEKRDFADSEEALRDRWRKLLKLQALQRVAQMEETLEALQKGEAEDEEAKKALERAAKKIPSSEEARWEKARKDLKASYEGRFKRLADADPLDPAETFLNAMAAVYDPHTVYLAPAAKENFDIEITGSLEGIGAVLGEDDHYIVVREVVPGGASWRQGMLESGDLILSVAQKGEEAVDVADMPIDKVVRMIRGPKGSTVILTVRKPDDSVKLISIVRDVVELEASYARGAVLDLGPKDEAVGYVYLPGFYGSPREGKGERNATDDVRKLLELFKKRRLDSAIIDLRGNGGGLLGHARDITGLLIEQGPVVQTQSSDGDREVLIDEDPSITFDGNVVVMVDRFSASASEILAAALQDYGRAVVVGSAGHTHGKGSVQVLADLDRMAPPTGGPLGVLKLTIQQYYRINGGSTQWNGVIPDVVLPDPVAYLESGERFLDHSLRPGKVQALRYDPWKATWDKASLAQQSQLRVKRSDAFKLVSARSALLEKRRDDTVIPLQKSAWTARRDRDEKSLDEVDPKLDEGDARFEASVLEYDGTKTPTRGKDVGKDPNQKWRDELTHDPWLEETLHIVSDMRKR